MNNEYFDPRISELMRKEERHRSHEEFLNAMRNDPFIHRAFQEGFSDGFRKGYNDAMEYVERRNRK